MVIIQIHELCEDKFEDLSEDIADSIWGGCLDEYTKALEDAYASGNYAASAEIAAEYSACFLSEAPNA